ncbi:Hypothetical predicted protein [Mytilus galloprovincialis]|uniref:C-type lectin domain-containing protein n=1 Tax=Mytilus galloprovincialis TaxID=29158 RepID=A0A8B6F2Z7_MYTGA|nr:Hypothetical predicted protein [Mytilus galloprovincialis]
MDTIIHSATVLSDITCAHWCLNTPTCCSASYEITTKECLLDSCCYPDTQPSMNGIFIQKTEKSSREQECIDSVGFIFSTTANVCYHIGPEIAINFTYINTFCPSIGSELIKIDSYEKHVFAQDIAATSVRICIQGNKDNTDFQFRFDDGSQMNYFLWDIGQPANKNDQHYLIMTKRENANLYQWNDVFKLRLDLQCLVICEK